MELRAWKATRRAFVDPRAVGVMRAGPRTVAFMRRLAAQDGEHRPSVGLAAQVFLDEVLISAMRNPRLMPHGDDFARAGDDMRAAHRMWREHGWLEMPAAYHRDPPMPEVTVSRDRVTFPAPTNRTRASPDANAGSPTAPTAPPM